MNLQNNEKLNTNKFLQKRLPLLCVISTIAGCASFQSEIDLWIGIHIDEAISIQGVPNSSFRRQDGGMTYTWNTGKSKSVSLNGIIVGVNATTHAECRKTLTTDVSGIITAFSHIGCKLKDNASIPAPKKLIMELETMPGMENVPWEY